MATLILKAGDGGINGAAVVNIAIQIVLPFALGQAFRPLIGNWINKHRLVSLTVDRGSILLIVYSAFSAGMVAGVWSEVDALTLAVIAAIVCLFLALAIGISLGLGRLASFTGEDNRALSFCGSTKSLASGVPIANILFFRAARSASSSCP